MASLPVGATGRNQEEETALMKKFPPGPDFGLPENQFSRAATVLDKEGTILLWYLPGVVSKNAQVSEFCKKGINGMT
jgi:hypothetical protein